ncbi:MAG: tetratricopeptide repeat protein [Syntrophorhabdaceae bacterium]|nr:tetratricopeptide repeat protein [Syntrophorhabdaceae bacterium]
MSIIHDALKKAQEQRKGSGAGSPLGDSQPEAKKKPSAVLIAVVLAVAVAVVAYLYIPAFHRGKAPPPQQPKIPVSSPAGVAKTPAAAQSAPDPEPQPQTVRTAAVAVKPQPATEANETGLARQQSAPAKKQMAERDATKAPRGLKPAVSGTKPLPPSLVDAQGAPTTRHPRVVAGSHTKDREEPDEEPIRRTRIRRTDDERIDAQFNEALRAINSGQTGDGSRIFNDILARRPNHVESLNNLGVIAASRGNKKEALSYFKKILEYEANYPKAYNNIGLVMMSDGQPQLAEEYFRKAISLDPNGLEPYMNLCAVLRAQGRFQDADKIMETPIKKNPKDPLLLLSSAVIKDNLGQTGEAVKYYRQYLSLAKPSDAQRNGVLERLKYLEGKK